MKRRILSSVNSCLYMTLWVLVSGLFFQMQGQAQTKDGYQWGKNAATLAVFKPGDAVRVQVFDLQMSEYGVHDLNLSANYPINPEGFIIMPLIGAVKVKGYTVYEVEKALQGRLSDELKNLYVYVRPLMRITLQGAFNKPGAYHVDPSSSVWDVVKMAGGPSGEADLAKMRIERGGKVVIPKVLEAFEKSISLEEVGIASGDQIVVPARGGLGLNTIITLFNLFASIVLVYLRLKSGAL